MRYFNGNFQQTNLHLSRMWENIPQEFFPLMGKLSTL